MADLITSRQNPLVKQLEGIRDDRDSPLMFLEGPRLVQEVLSTKLPIEILVWTKSADGDPVLEAAKPQAKRLFRVADPLFRSISDVDAPQGMLAIARCPRWTWKDLLNKAPAPLVILDGVQDPGNVATIVRTVEASGAGGLITTPGTAHLYAPKALRGAAGSSLRVTVLEHRPAAEIVAELKKADYHFLAATVSTKAERVFPYLDVNWNWPSAIILGQEGQGISSAWGSAVDQFIFIPMDSPVESLNVSAAAAILLYEARRSRK